MRTDAVFGAAALSVGSIVFAVLGLTPGLQWIPEVPLIAAGLLFPVVVWAIVGYRARSPAGGALGAAITGLAGGAVGGLGYVLYGRSPVNILAGMLLGGLGGAVVGFLAAALRQRTVR